MALSGKWGKALLACFITNGITFLPTFIYIFLTLNSTLELPDSYEANLIDRLINLAWSIFVTLPLTYSCIIGLRQMHVANEQPKNVMFDKFKQNWIRYIKLGAKVALKILAIIAIPFVIYMISIFSAGINSSIIGLSFLFILACLVIYYYKFFEYIFVPVVANDNPEMTDKEILNKSSELTNGYKGTIFKIYLQGIIPALLIYMLVGFVAIIALIIVIGEIAVTGEWNNFDSFQPYINDTLTVFIFAYLITTILLFSYVFVRISLPLSVLYSELTGFNDKKNEGPITPVLLPGNGSNSTTEESAKEEEKKVEPEIPYEQRYMPKGMIPTESKETPKNENVEKKDDDDIPYEQRYMPR